MAERREIRPLTGFRGVAALVVVTYHFVLAMGGSAPFLFDRGYLAVDAFFVLSGYVLAYNYDATFRVGADVAKYREFLFRRFVRLYPAYIVILSLGVIKLAIRPGLGDFTAWDAFCNLFMLTGWGLHAKPVIGLSWSVSAEIFCYAAFPLVLMLGRLKTMGTCVALLGLALLIVTISRIGGGISGPMDVVSDVTVFPLLRALAGFSIGVILCGLAARRAAFKTSVADLGTLVACLAVAAAATFDHSDLVTYLCIVGAVFWLAADSPLSNALFANGPVYRLGEISYSLYLIHPLVFSAFGRPMLALQPMIGARTTLAIAYVVCVGATILLASLSYRFVEIGGKRALMQLRQNVLKPASR